MKSLNVTLFVITKNFRKALSAHQQISGYSISVHEFMNTVEYIGYFAASKKYLILLYVLLEMISKIRYLSEKYLSNNMYYNVLLFKMYLLGLGI